MKGDEWKNAYEECWELGPALGIPRSLLGRWLVKPQGQGGQPAEKVAQALRAADGKKDPVSYVIGVLSK